MRDLVLDKRKRTEFIHFLIRKHQIVGPVEKSGIIVFQQIKDPKEVVFDFDNSKMPAKSLCFPQTETLFRFTTDEEIHLKTPKKQQDAVLFGIRPCDAKSLTILDAVFGGDYKDHLFFSKRNNIVLIGLACVNPPSTCFCTSVNGKPDDTKGLDILLTDIGSKYYVQVVTRKGEQLINTYDGCTPPTADDKKKKQSISKKAREAIKRKVNTENIEQILDGIFEHPYWETIAQRCLGCGICTFLCPTCHCFDIQDEIVGKKGARVRVWDSCMYSEYTLQASGYNPRPTQMNRVRNRMYHKFSYFPKNHKVIGCVGCGRCIAECPVNIDIIEVINNAREVK